MIGIFIDWAWKIQGHSSFKAITHNIYIQRKQDYKKEIYMNTIENKRLNKTRNCISIALKMQKFKMN